VYLRAKWIVPIPAPPIEDGWIQIEDGVIVALGQGPLDEAARDLGDSALFPGLINGHAHLEFDQADHPKHSFAAWAASVQESAPAADVWQRNVQRMLETGTTTVVNHFNGGIAAPFAAANEGPIPPNPSCSAEVNPASHASSWQDPALRIIQICEFIGSNAELGAESYRDACAQRLELLESKQVDGAVVSPHSLYAVSPIVWDEFIQHRTATDLISLHLLESAEEEELFRKGKGPLARLVKERGGLLWQHDPIGWLKEKKLLRPGTLLIHANYLTDDDWALLPGTGTGVIHCPGSHAYFGHRRFPVTDVLDRGIPVGLGTDSRASNEDVSMLRELSLLHESHPELTAEQVIHLATLSGARAIGLDKTRGSLEPDKDADLIVVPLGSEESPYEALLKAEQVSASFIRGKEVISHGL